MPDSKYKKPCGIERPFLIFCYPDSKRFPAITFPGKAVRTIAVVGADDLIVDKNGAKWVIFADFLHPVLHSFLHTVPMLGYKSSFYNYQKFLKCFEQHTNV